MARRGGNQSREHAARIKAIKTVLAYKFQAIAVETDAGILRKHGVQRRPSGIPEGWVDLIAVLPHRRTLFIEVKTGKADLSKDQQAMRERIEGRGHEYVLARSVDDVISAVEGNERTET